MAEDVAADGPAAEPSTSIEEPPRKGKKALASTSTASTLSHSATLSFFKTALADAGSATTSAQEPGSEPGLSSMSSTTSKRQRAPGARWDGRAVSASQQEWRESKWSLEAAYQRTMRGSPSYTCRAQYKGPKPVSAAASVPQIALDVEKSFNYIQKKQPVASFTFALHSIGQREQDLAPGPIYAIPSPIDSVPHPTLKNVVNTKFGTGTLPQIDKVCPGPGTYDSMRASRQDSRYATQPRFSISGREAMRELDMPPSDVAIKGKNGRPGKMRVSGPAPGDYQIDGARGPTGTFKSVKWTMPHAGGRTETKVKETDGFGPGAYEVTNLTNKGKLSSPKWSMQGNNPWAE